MENPIKMDDFGVPPIQIAPTSKVQDSCIFGTKKHVGETSKLLGDTHRLPVGHEVCASVPGCDVQKRALTLDRAEAAFAQHRNRMQVAVVCSRWGGANKRGMVTNWGENNWARWLKFVEMKIISQQNTNKNASLEIKHLMKFVEKGKMAREDAFGKMARILEGKMLKSSSKPFFSDWWALVKVLGGGKTVFLDFWHHCWQEEPCSQVLGHNKKTITKGFQTNSRWIAHPGKKQLDGGFQHFLFSSLFGKDSHFD